MLNASRVSVNENDAPELNTVVSDASSDESQVASPMKPYLYVDVSGLRSNTVAETFSIPTGPAATLSVNVITGAVRSILKSLIEALAYVVFPASSVARAQR